MYPMYGLILGQRRRRLANIKPALVQRLVSAGMCSVSNPVRAKYDGP